jgi:hypothetical protein
MTPNKIPKYHPGRALQKGQKKQKIILCDECYNYVDSDDWTFTDGKSDYCVISGEGGEIYSCDNCPNSFCAMIMEKFLGKPAFKKISADEDAPFVCWTCDDSVGNYTDFKKKSVEMFDYFNHSSSKTPPKKSVEKSATKSAFKSASKSSTKSVSKSERKSEKVEKKSPPVPPRSRVSITDSPKANSPVKISQKAKIVSEKPKPESPKLTKDFFDSSDSEDESPKKDPESRVKDQLKEILNISASEHSNTETFKAVMEVLNSKKQF